MDFEEDSLADAGRMFKETRDMEDPGISPIRNEEEEKRNVQSIRGPAQRIRQPMGLRDLSESINRSLDELETRSLRRGFLTRQKTVTRVLSRERMRSLKDFYLKERKSYESLVKEDLKEEGCLKTCRHSGQSINSGTLLYIFNYSKSSMVKLKFPRFQI